MARISARELIDSVIDPGTFTSWDAPADHGDIDDAYRGSLDRAREKTGVDEAIVTGAGEVAGHRVGIICSEFPFLGGTVGAATSRRLIEGIERATAEGLPLLVSPTSGGTRMQEGTPAFAMMISITAAVTRHKATGLPFLVYLRHPTTGGVMASWGSSGHVTFGEPGALLGFLGPRVVEIATGEPMPEGVQLAENLTDHGIIDGVVTLDELRESTRKLVTCVAPADAVRPAPEPAPEAVPDGRDVWASILATREPSRPGGGAIYDGLVEHMARLSGTGGGYKGDAIRAGIARIGGRPVMLIVQDRHKQPPLGGCPMGPGALRFAQRAITVAEGLRIPIATVIDTAGAELTKDAEEAAMAGEIARTLTALLGAAVPTVSLILGQGCGGGALCLVPADKVLAMHDAWMSPLPPEGASAIIHRDADHAPEMMADQDVSSEAMAAAGVVDRIIAEPDDDRDLPARALAAIDYALWEVEQADPGEPGARRTARLDRWRGYAFGG